MTTNFLELATTLKYLGTKWLPENKVNFTPYNNNIANSSQFLHHVMCYGHGMFKGNSQKGARYLSFLVYRCRIDQTVKNYPVMV